MDEGRHSPGWVHMHEQHTLLPATADEQSIDLLVNRLPFRKMSTHNRSAPRSMAPFGEEAKLVSDAFKEGKPAAAYQGWTPRLSAPGTPVSWVDNGDKVCAPV